MVADDKSSPSGDSLAMANHDRDSISQRIFPTDCQPEAQLDTSLGFWHRQANYRLNCLAQTLWWQQDDMDTVERNPVCDIQVKERRGSAEASRQESGPTNSLAQVPPPESAETF